MESAMVRDDQILIRGVEGVMVGQRRKSLVGAFEVPAILHTRQGLACATAQKVLGSIVAVSMYTELLKS